MNLPTRSNSLQTYQVVLYRRPLHPEAFPLKARRNLSHGQYELEAWLMPAAHILRYRYNGFCACELVTDQDGNLPVDGAVITLPCAGEQEYEHSFPSERVGYTFSAQTETLSENLFVATYDEMVEFSQETGSLSHAWTDADGGKNLSILELQRLQREVHVQSFHLLANCGLVLRTQTIFEHH